MQAAWEHVPIVRQFLPEENLFLMNLEQLLKELGMLLRKE